MRACSSDADGEPGSDKATAVVNLFAALADALAPVLTRLLQPDAIDLFDETLEVLDLLLQYGPSPLPLSLWSLFPRLYQCVCGGSTPSLPLPAALLRGWGQDYMCQLVTPMSRYVTRGPLEEFLTQTWAEAKMTYPEMLFNVFREGLRMPDDGAGSSQAAIKLGMVLLEVAPAPVAAPWIPQYFDELWLRMPQAETPELRRRILLSLFTLVWCDAGAFLRHLTQQGRCEDFHQAWTRSIELFQALSHRKILVLGLMCILELAFSQSMPATLTDGVPVMIQHLFAQSRAIVGLRRELKETIGKDDSEDEESDGAEEGAIDSILEKLQRIPDTCDEEAVSFPVSDDLDHEDQSAAIKHIDEIALLAKMLLNAPGAMQQQVLRFTGVSASQWAAEISQS